jgi:hypothetical protein
MDEFGKPAQKANERDRGDAPVSSGEFKIEEQATGRIRVVDPGPDPGPDEDTFAPAASAAQRMAVSPNDVAVNEASTAEILAVNAGASDRLVAPAGKQPVSAPSEWFPLSKDSGERVSMRPDPAKGEESLVEAYGAPTSEAGERILLVPLPDVPDIGSVLETFGMPAVGAGERIGIWPVSTAAGTELSPLEGVGDPSGIRSDRHPLLIQPDLDGAGNVLEHYGEPSTTSATRLGIYEAPELEAGRSMEIFGEPSSQSSNRTPTTPLPDDGALKLGDVLERYGTPSTTSATRIDIHENPDHETIRSVEAVGHPSVTRKDRASVSPQPDLGAIDDALTIGRYGEPTTKASHRVELTPLSEVSSGATLEKYGDPHKRSKPRIELQPNSDFIPDASTLRHIGKPLRNRAARIELEDKPDISAENSTMNSAAQSSHDRTNRMGRVDPEAVDLDDSQAAAALKLATDAVERFGYVDPDETRGSPLPDIATPAMLEAGRVPVQPAENSIRSTVPNGLEGLMPDPRLRGHDRMRLTEYEDYELPPELMGKVPIPPRVVEVEGSLPKAERYGACGEERVLKKEVTHRRMDFLYQRYEELHVRRRYYHCPFTPEEPIYKCREPRFVAGLAPLGNGLLAQLLASIYDDHSSVTDQAGILDRLGFTLDEKHIETGIDNATAAIQPILDALHKEFLSGDGRPGVDKKLVDSTFPGTKNRPAEGQLLFASRVDAKILIHLKKGESHPLLKDTPPSRRKGELIQDLFRERVGYNRAGVWAGVRRRFTLALATSPREAAYGLFLIHAISAAASPAHGQHDELVRRSRALRAWLDDQRDQFEDPDNPLQRAVIYTLSSWDRMRFVDDSGDGAAIAAPEARGFPKNYVPLWTFDTEAKIHRATTWYSLIHTCRLLGIRPWEYLFDCFSALSKQQVTQPEQWTPSAWARAIRG